jgi:hypothetical protein
MPAPGDAALALKMQADNGAVSEHIVISIAPPAARAGGERALEDQPRHSSYALTIRSSLES